jgi:hypothetical protein
MLPHLPLEFDSRHRGDKAKNRQPVQLGR